LFEIRHILCHELPEKPVYSVSEVAEFLEEATRFTKAIEEIVTFEKYGLVPLTNTDMKIAASEKLKRKQEDMDRLLVAIRAFLTDRDQGNAKFGSDGISLLSYFNDAQDKWVAYQKANCGIVAGMYWGGTIMGLIWSFEGTRMTEARIEELQSWFDRESNM
jgi:uncharacterized protein YecT (DUF1311 family)